VNRPLLEIYTNFRGAEKRTGSERTEWKCLQN